MAGVTVTMLPSLLMVMVVKGHTKTFCEEDTWDIAACLPGRNNTADFVAVLRVIPAYLLLSACEGSCVSKKCRAISGGFP
ncbi:hypothetical protein GCM10009825_01560 [Arthrobacter humicola]|uniref:Uncharacterized protein n=1 Tax=Arthrobacter humicola TaxID=409291 RepID=A0ABP5K594_9MICC